MSPGLLLDELGLGCLLKDVKICCRFLVIVQPQLSSLETAVRDEDVLHIRASQLPLEAALLDPLQLCCSLHKFAGSGAAPFRHIKYRSHIMKINQI